MADSMSVSQLPLTLIVAATAKNGIGKSGGLPWPMLKKDMGYFARVTKRVPILEQTGSLRADARKKAVLDEASRNVVIMGRKTWESIPSRFRPLKDRTSIVISSQDRTKLGTIPDDVIVASDILSGLRTLEALVSKDKAMSTSRVFVIGGSSIYKAALELPQTNRILLTRILKDYECDTFFPVVLDENNVSRQSPWRRATHQELQDFVAEQVEKAPATDKAGEEDVGLDFQLWERV